MKQLLPFLALLVLPASGVTITQWNFEASNTTASTGTGTASLVGGTTATFATGSGGGFGWNTTTYSSQSVGSGTRGVAFFMSTAGYENITIAFEHRASGTASRWAQLEYTTDGGSSWTAFGNNAGGLSPHDTFSGFSFDLSSVPAADNDADFGFRVVSIFSPVAFDQNASLADFSANTAYQRANAQSGFAPGSGTGTGDYGSGGTWRFDNVTVSGITAVPEPAAAMLGSLGIMALLRRRRIR